LTDESGTIRTTYSYDPFGNVTVSGEVSDNPFQFAGRENDGTGLYYYRARYYNPVLQRFISEDPIEVQHANSNLYGYVTNNPLLYIDPFGLRHDTFPGGCMNPTGSCRPPSGRATEQAKKSKSADSSSLNSLTPFSGLPFDIKWGIQSPVGGAETTFHGSGRPPTTTQLAPSLNSPVPGCQFCNVSIQVSAQGKTIIIEGSLSTPLGGIQAGVDLLGNATGIQLLGPRLNFPLGYGVNVYVQPTIPVQ